jgi:hypothetical protein
MEITFEVARLGESLSRRHKTRRKVPARNADALFALFSAFQHFPSCLMYAGFKRIAPEQDTAMDLNEPRIGTLELLDVGKRS